MKWIKINKDKANQIPQIDCWVFNDESGYMKLSYKGEFLPLHCYTHYMEVKRPEPPK